MAKSMSEVRPDHLARYQVAKHWLVSNKKTNLVLDAGCGVGYGSALLSDSIEKIVSIDSSDAAFKIHQEYFLKPNIDFICSDIFNAQLKGPYDAVVSFEFLEHITQAREAVELFGTLSRILICSTPNEIIRPHKMEPVNPYHVRHYTPDEFEALIESGGYKVKAKFNQRGGMDPNLRPGWNGKFMIAVGVK